jgi:hypothetical protein
MPSYRLYNLSRDGHFTDIHDVNLEDDRAAVAAAEDRLGNAYAIDVFNDGRRVARVESEESKLASAASPSS